MTASAPQQKLLERSVLEAINHIVKNNPELRSDLFKVACHAVGLNPGDIAVLTALNRGKLEHSKAQLRQDLLILSLLNDKKGGFFVEFGATDGIGLSNTHLLETRYQWSGILAEPARCWHPALTRNRGCNIDTRCVWHSTGEVLSFRETAEPALSTIADYGKEDMHREARERAVEYDVPTVSLRDLLRMHDAPRRIDYLSVDTEGSELEILEAFDFSEYDVDIITVEHNFTRSRESINRLLSGNGFFRIFPELSQFDDWYVNRQSPAMERYAILS
jgi:FkbM family methyltransferase